MLIHTQVGPQAGGQSMSPSTVISQRSGQLGDTILSGLHGRYYEQAYRRNIYLAANQTAVTTTVGLATTYTGLVLSNPVGSPVNLEVLRVGYGFTIAFTASAVIGLMTGFNSATNVVHTTVVTPASTFYGVGPTPYAKVDATSTAGLSATPIVAMILSSAGTGILTTQVGLPLTTVDLDGSIILPPGAFVAFYTSTASGTSGFMGSFMWAEVPL